MGNNSRIFACVFSTGISYYDRQTEEHGDYKKLAFPPFNTFVLEVTKDCPLEFLPDIRLRTDSDAGPVVSYVCPIAIILG